MERGLGSLEEEGTLHTDTRRGRETQAGLRVTHTQQGAPGARPPQGQRIPSRSLWRGRGPANTLT